MFPDPRRWRLAIWLTLVAVVATGAAATRQEWLRAIGNVLVCTESAGVSDAILIENVETDYRLFERARRLQLRGLSHTILIPVLGPDSNEEPVAVELGIVDVMCRIAGLQHCTTFSASANEPISLHVARRAAEELRARGARSVIVVTDGFRSRRTADIYTRVLTRSGITVHMQPVFGRRTPDNWYQSWHGLQDVFLQFGKLLYYRIAVL